MARATRASGVRYLKAVRVRSRGVVVVALSVGAFDRSRVLEAQEATGRRRALASAREVPAAGARANRTPTGPAPPSAGLAHSLGARP